MPELDYPNQTILITGASSGIGAAFARALAARGADLVLVARRRDRLDALATELEDANGVTVAAITQDLGSASVGRELAVSVAEAGLHVTSIINNARFGTFGDFVGENLDRLDQEIAVDIRAPVQISSVFLPDMVKAGEGFLINVASMAAYTPTPRMAVYDAAKAFVLSFTESLWPRPGRRESRSSPFRRARPAPSSTLLLAPTTPPLEPGCAHPTMSLPQH